MNRYDFTQRAAVVTGGAQGIGYAVAERLLEGGARVALWDRDEQALSIARADLAKHGDVETVHVDLTDGFGGELVHDGRGVRSVRGARDLLTTAVRR